MGGMSGDGEARTRGLNERYLFGYVYEVDRKNDGTEEVILNKDLYSSYVPEGPLVKLEEAYLANFNIQGRKEPYRRTGELSFDDLPYSEEIHVKTTPSDEEVKQLLEGRKAFIKILPKFMDPNRVGRNPMA